MKKLIIFLFLVVPICVYGADVQQLTSQIEKLQPLDKTLHAPGPHDWLSFNNEPGQTFQEYTEGNPIVVTDQRNIIYIQPIGDFTDTQKRIVEITAQFMSKFFNLEVRVNSGIALSQISDSAKRVHPTLGMDQILSTYVMEEILIPKLPADAATMIAITSSDLWPGQGWNFVFGQASIDDRVGVWSIYRNGEPDKSKEDFQLALMRTLKTAIHETAHMFSLMHCIKYECGMNGSNHRKESDDRPFWFCVKDAAKICYATNTTMVARYKNLAKICRKYGFVIEAEFYETMIKEVK